MNAYRCENCTRFPTCIFRQDSNVEKYLKLFLGESAYSVTKDGFSYVNFVDFCDNSNIKKEGNLDD